MLYDPDGDQVVRLNATARRIWELCTGHNDLSVIVWALQSSFAGATEIDVRRDVAETVRQFAAAGLLS